jgi:SAM-dependent methyltransferase
MDLPLKKYISKDYFNNNPSWDIEDSLWKSVFVDKLLRSNGITLESICDLGCGAGGVLAELRLKYPRAKLYGYDIAPDAEAFWPQHKQKNINFFSGDFLKLNKETYDVILLLDVIEHLADPFSFLSGLSDKAKYFVFHFPLDLSAINVLREKPILHAREKTGHIHYFTKNLALALINECGFKVIEWQYSEVAFSGPRHSLKTKLANIPRMILQTINKELGVRVLGGESLFVLVQSKK